LNNITADCSQTREEKKLEAIVKAFERMEKREQHQRKKEALLEQSKKPKEKDKDGYRAGKSDRDSGKCESSGNLSQKQHSVVCHVTQSVFLHSTDEAVNGIVKSIHGVPKNCPARKEIC